MSSASPPRTVRHFFMSAPDGLRLHARGFGTRDRRRTPVVCLPGLARTTDDFDTLAQALANDPERPRYVLAIDYRGRGKSEYDRDPANYSIATEVADLLAILTALEIEPAVFVGTSRGGILAMALACVRPGAIAGVVLNDIGPVIETKGLVRIKSYLGRLPQPKSWDDAAEILRHLFAAQFPKLGPDDWTMFARRTFKEQDGSFKPPLRSETRRRAQGRRRGAFGAAALEGVRRPRRGSGHGRARRQFRSPHGRNGRRHARQAAGPRYAWKFPIKAMRRYLTESDVIAEIAGFIDRC